MPMTGFPGANTAAPQAGIACFFLGNGGFRCSSEKTTPFSQETLNGSGEISIGPPRTCLGKRCSAKAVELITLRPHTRYQCAGFPRWYLRPPKNIRAAVGEHRRYLLRVPTTGPGRCSE